MSFSPDGGRRRSRSLRSAIGESCRWTLDHVGPLCRTVEDTQKGDYSGSDAAAVVPATVCNGLTLFQIEENIALLAESAEEGGLTPEFEQALAAYLQFKTATG